MSVNNTRIRQEPASVVMESSLACPKDVCCHESSCASCCMDHPGTCKINNSYITEWLVETSAQESVAAPNGMCDNGVHKTCQKQRIEKVGRHLTPFCQGTSDNSDRCQLKKVGKMQSKEKLLQTPKRNDQETCQLLKMQIERTKSPGPHLQLQRSSFFQ